MPTREEWYAIFKSQRQAWNEAILPVLDAFEAAGWERYVTWKASRSREPAPEYSTIELADVLERVSTLLNHDPYAWDVSGRDWARHLIEGTEDEERREHIFGTIKVVWFGWMTFVENQEHSGNYDPQLAAEGKARGRT